MVILRSVGPKLGADRPKATVAPLSLLVPVFGLLGSVIIFNESLSVNKIVAVVLIVSGLGVGLYEQRVLSAVLKRSDRCPS
jgi:O-acetylserine/cysteine efflux transporter